MAEVEIKEEQRGTKRPNEDSEESEENIEVEEVEGFRIFSAYEDNDSFRNPVGLYREGEENEEDEEGFEDNDSKMEDSSISVTLLKEALTDLGRATALKITDWILTKKPDIKQSFLDKKKLQYSVIATLSSKDNINIFGKESPTTGRKIEWFLIDENDSNSSEICCLCATPGKMVKCASCEKNFHLACVEPPLLRKPRKPWYCSSCEKPAKKRKIERVIETPGEIIVNVTNRNAPTEILTDKEGFIISPRACEKHRRWKKKCPPDCSMRSRLKPGTKITTVFSGKKTKSITINPENIGKEIPLINTDSNNKISPITTPSITPPQLETEFSDTNRLLEMTSQAIQELGNRTKLEDIQIYFENHFHTEINGFSWKGPLLTCLKTHFAELPSDEKRGELMWVFINEENRSNKMKTPKLFDPSHVQALRIKYPESSPFANFNGIHYINRTSPLGLDSRSPLTHSSPVFCMNWSNNGNSLVTGSNLITIWNVANWKKTKEIASLEVQEQYFTVSFSPNDKKVIGAGKTITKEGIEEFPIRVWDIKSGKNILNLEGHKNNVLHLEVVYFKEEFYIVSCGEDGSLIKWHINIEFNKLIKKISLSENTLTIRRFGFIPNYGNKFLVSTCDNGIAFFDFETHQLLHKIPNIYDSICDDISFIDCGEIKSKHNEIFVLLKGKMNSETTQTVCDLKILSIPLKGTGEFKLKEKCQYSHAHCLSGENSMLCSNGRYILCPTQDGRVFIWNLSNKQLVGILNDSSCEIYSSLFHPFKQILLTGGKDGFVNVYVPIKKEELSNNQEKILDEQGIKEEMSPQVTLESPEEGKSQKKKTKISPKKIDIDPSKQESQTEKRIRLFGYACEKHRREHLRCPLTCPARRKLRNSQEENEMQYQEN